MRVAKRLISTARVLRSAAPAAPTGALPEDLASNPIVAPAANPSLAYQDDFYRNRGIRVADKGWTGWDDLPLPYKHFDVKVNPKDVENAGFLWKAMYDWRLSVPMALLCAMPLWMTGNLPGFDERLELGLITFLAGGVMMKEAAPIFKNMQEKDLREKNEALLAREKRKNERIAAAIAHDKLGVAIPETMKMVHDAERALRKLEVAASNVKARNAARDATFAELEYLVQLKASAAGATGSATVREASAAVATAFEKDAALQQRSIEAAIKALREGSQAPADDVVGPTFAAALAAARRDAAAKPASNPFKSAAQRETFDKRFGYGPSGKSVSKGNTVPSPFTLAK